MPSGRSPGADTASPSNRHAYDPEVRRIATLADLFAIGLPLVGGAMVLGCIAGVASGHGWIAAACAVGALASAAGVLWPRRRLEMPPAADGVTLVAVNLWYLNPSVEQAVADVLACRPDVAVVSEVGDVADRALSAALPHRVLLWREGSKGHGVYSRWPLEQLPLPKDMGAFAHVKVAGPVPMTLLAIHVRRPVLFRSRQNETTSFAQFHAANRRLIDWLDASDPELVVAGDFNTCDRQVGYWQLVRRKADALRSQPARSTFRKGRFWRLLVLRIDHVFIPRGWAASSARTVGVTGSDHRAVAVTIAPADGAGTAR